MSKYRQNTIRLSLFLLFTVAVVLIMSAPVLAQAPTPTAPAAAAAVPFRGQFGNAITGIAGRLTDVAVPAVAILIGIALLQSFLTLLLSVASFLLNQLFYYNTLLNPGNISVVQEGWGIMRDVANGVFILILLWIAFTIIFSIEGNQGGRRLLVRVIVIALLINFSLAMVSAVFAFANVLARPFQNAIKTTDVAGLIIAKSKIHTIVSQVRDEGVLKDFESQVKKMDIETRAQKAIEEGSRTGGADQTRSNIWQYLGAPKTAEAGIGTTLLCGLGLLGGVTTPAAAGCIAASIAIPFAVGIVSWFTAGSIIQSVWNAVLNIAVADIFLILTTFALATAAIVLLARIVAMMLLAMLAPAALMLHMLPSSFAQKLWKDWLDGVIKWAFYVPAFYFLFFMSLRVLETMSKGNEFFEESIPLQGNLFAIFTLIVFLAFLFSSILVARKMGITIADSFINWGQKLGMGALGFAGGVAGGLLRTAGGALFRAVAPPGGRVQRTLQKTAGVPGLRALGGVAAGAYLGQLAAQQKAVEEAASRLKPLSKEEKIAAFRRSQLARDKVAAAVALGDDLKELLPEEAAEVERSLRLAQNFGMQQPILEAVPHLATSQNVLGATDDKAAVETVVKKIPDKTKLTPYSYDLATVPIDPATGRPDTAKEEQVRNVLGAVWKFSDTKDLGQIGFRNQGLMQAMKQHVTSMNPDQLKTFKDSLGEARETQFDSYFTGHMAGGAGIGWAPDNWGSGRIPHITVGNLPDGRVGRDYNFTVGLRGGTAPFEWAATGTLPPGLRLAGDSGQISGTPEAAGTYNFTVTVTEPATGRRSTAPLTINIR